MRREYTVFLLGILLAGCAAAPQLDAKPAGNPNQIDLSGNWTLRGDVTRPVDSGQTIRIPPAISRTMPASGRTASKRSRSKDSSVHIFLESGKDLRVTQTPYGLFFSFDRAIVEEYAFGENRVVNIGPIEAQRVAGWEGSSFVVETMDEKGNVLVESWTLEDDGNVLIRELRISEREEPVWSSRQVFDRE